MHALIKRLLISFVLVLPITISAQPAQTSSTPLTSREIVSMVYQLPRRPDLRDEIVTEIRKRGIGFPLTDGLRSVVATKRGNDSLLRRTLEEAERRRVNPAASTLPSETEGNELLERTRNVTLAAANAMPDFIVKQIIKRYIAYGNTGNWRTQDNLTFAVGYRANVGEEYKLLTVDGMPVGPEVQASRDSGKYAPKGARSSGVEYISALADIFKPETKTEFRMVDTDVIQTRRTVVYEYLVKKEFSIFSLTYGDDSGVRTYVGARGRLWIDRELDRVLRFEQILTEIPPDFPIFAASTLIDYDWVTINERKYLLPTHSEVLMSSVNPNSVLQSRNDIRFRGYQKYGAELKVADEVGEEDEPPKPVKPPR